MCEVSVIMPAYNSEKYIGEAIESVIAQTYKNWELIIVNDGSKDATSEVVKKYDDKRIVFVDNAENQGFLYSLNYAISIAKGEYIARLDDDDVACSDRFELQVSYLNSNPDILLVGGYCDYLKKGRVKCGPRFPMRTPEEIKFSLAFGNFCLGHSSFMMRKEIFTKYDIKYEIFKQVPDCHMQHEISLVGKIGSLNRKVFDYRIHATQSTAVRSMNMKLRERDICFCMYIDKLSIEDEEKEILKKACCRDLSSKNDYEAFSKAFVGYAKQCGLLTEQRDLRNSEVYKFLFKSIINEQKKDMILYKTYMNSAFRKHGLKALLWNVKLYYECRFNRNENYYPPMVDYTKSMSEVL